MFKGLWSKIGRVWCTLLHKSLMWPVHGAYQCAACGRRYPAFAEAPIAIGHSALQQNRSDRSFPERLRMVA